MRKHRGRRWGGLALALIITVSINANAQPATLDVSGKISRYTDRKAGTYRFSEVELLELPQYHIVTATSWTPRSEFVGPLLLDVLARVGAHGTTLEFHSLNQYTFAIPVADAARYGVILALSRDGKRLTPSDFGPIFVVYPRDQYPHELKTPITEAKYVWQVTGFRVQ